MSDSVRPHRRQPTRLPRPWDSPVKNTGLGCHFLLQCMKMKSESEVAQSCLTLSNPMDCSPPGSSIHGILQTRVLEWGAIAFSILMMKLPQIEIVFFLISSYINWTPLTFSTWLFLPIRFKMFSRSHTIFILNPQCWYPLGTWWLNEWVNIQPGWNVKDKNITVL